MNKILATFPVYFFKVEAANETEIPVVVYARLPCLATSLIVID
jgi:hypothetical protein